MRNFAAILFTAFAVLNALVLSAQTQNAQLTGTVRDPAGAVVPAAEIRLSNTASGVSRSTAANQSGAYTFVNVIPGPYRVEVTHAGFAKATSETLNLDVNQSATLDIQLTIGTVGESVQVSAETALLESSTAQLGTVVTEEKILELPLNARNFTQLLTLTPGATPVSVGQNNGGAQAQRIGTIVFPSINGQSNRSNSFTLDGVYNNGHFMGTYAVAPSVDALSQFKVQSHSDQAEFGGVSGGVVNIASKSGTNAFHGSAYEFFRNDKLDARGFFTASKPPLRQNQFGATVGGPIRRDKTFFFFSYEGYRQLNPSSRLALVPTRAQLGGNFSGLNRQIYDPFTSRPNPSDPLRTVRDAFPGNIVPVSRLNASTKAWAETIIPQEINTGFAGFNARNDDPQKFPANQYSVRGDHNFSPSDFLWARYTWGQQNTRAAQPLQGTSTGTDTPAKNFGVSYTHIFGSQMVWNTLFGFSSLTASDSPFLTGTELIGTYFKGMPDHPDLNAPGVNMPSAFGAVSARIRKLGPMQGWQWRSDVTRTAGTHNFKFGGEIVRQPWSNAQVDGNLGFNTLQTADLDRPGTTGSDIASFVLGVMDNTLYARPDFKLESQLWAFYFQDSWRVTPKLTFNYGLRWDLVRNPAYTRDAAGTWDMSTGQFLAGRPTPPACSAAAPPCLVDPNNAFNRQWIVFTGNSQLRPNDYKMFGPRMGLAYRLRSNLVLRASGAILYDLQAGVNQQAQNGSKWPNAESFNGQNLNRTGVEFAADLPFGNRDPRVPDPTPIRQTGFLYDPKFQNPYSEQWNFEIQKEFTAGVAVTMGYVGSHNLRSPISGNYNTALTPGPGPIAPRALWPHAPVISYDRSIGQSTYHGFQFKAEQRMSKGFSYLVAYTWSKSIDVASSGQFGVEGQSLQDAYDPNSSRGVSGYDIPHNFSAAVIYELPFGRGKPWLSNGLAARIAGNWQMNGILLLRSGQPFTPVTNIDIANVGAFDAQSRARPDLIGKAQLDKPTPDEWFNRAAFASPRAFTFGSAGRNQLRTDGYESIDVSIFREDRVTETVRTQLRIEAFNLFNHPTFGIPQTTITNPQFGRVSGTVSTARQIQLGLKILF